MTIATLTPPATPVVIYSVAGTGAAWTCTRSSGGAALATNTATPISACATALSAAVDHSTLVVLLSPSDTPLWNGQVSDMLTVTGA